MSLYSLYCDRCDRRTTHEESRGHDDHPDHLVKEHPRYDTVVVCRDCLGGRGKSNLPEDGAELWVTANVQQGLALTVHPEEIPDGTDLYEHLEDLLVENKGRLAREIADGIRDSQVEFKGIETDDMDGYPPYE